MLTATRRSVQTLAVAAGLLALIGLVSWQSGTWHWLTFGAGHVPMAPGTALLFLLLAAVVFLRSRWPASTVAVWVQVACLAAAALFGLLIRANAAFGLDWSLEQSLFGSAGSIAGVPVGRIGPYTVLSFVLAGAAILLQWPPWAGRRGAQYGALGTSFALLLNSLLTVFGYLIAKPLIDTGSTIPIAFLTALAFVLLSTALLLPLLMEGDLLALSDKQSTGGLAAEWRHHIAVALLCVLAAVALRFVMFGEIGRDTPYVTFFPAVMFAAMFGGLPAGLAASALSGIVSLYWIQGGVMNRPEWLAMATFLASCVMMSAIGQAMRQSRARVIVANERLEAEAAERRRAEADLAVLNAELMRDVAERKAAEWRTRKLARMYAVLSRSSDAILRCNNDDALFQAVCDAAVEAGGMKFAWVGLVDADSRMVVPVAHCGSGADYINDIRVSAIPGDPYSQGPTGTAIREDRPCWVGDFLADPRTAPWHERGLKFGLRASAALPLHRGGTVIGALTIYSDEVSAFDDEFKKLNTQLVENISFGLDVLAAQRARDRVLAELGESESKFRALTEQAVTGVYVIKDGDISYMNAAAAAIFGLETTEVVGKPLRDFITEEDWPLVQENIRKRMVGETETMQYEFRGRARDGSSPLVQVHGNVAVLGGRRVIIGVLRDVTAERAAAAELERHARESELARRSLLSVLEDRRFAEEALRSKTGELQARNEALTRFNRLTVDRELRMVELKQEINALLARAGEPARYAERNGPGGTLPAAAGPGNAPDKNE